MPRSTKSKRANRVFDPEAIEFGDTTEMPTATATIEETETVQRELPFEVNITPAEDGFKPDRSPAGRRRTPSPFEPLLPELKGKGWMNQPHDGKVTPDENGKYSSPECVKGSDAHVILRELSKAVKFLNSPEGGELNLGLDVNVTDSLVQFNVRDKQNRKPRTPSGDEASDGERDDDDDSTDNGDE